MNNLNQVYQDRLDKWRKKTTPVPSANKIRPKQSNYVARGDYGDDDRDRQSDGGITHK